MPQDMVQEKKKTDNSKLDTITIYSLDLPPKKPQL